jgi:tryptophan synthase alpha chain
MSSELVAAGEQAAVFGRCKAQGRASFIPFLVAGDPDADTSVDLILAAEQGGADLIEIGIPYSDPLADGPTIQRAASRALSRGMTFDGALEVARRARSRLRSAQLVGFSYYNPVLTRGIERTAKDFVSAGLCGLIVPDLPPMEAQPLLDAFAHHGLAVTLLVAPTTSAARAEIIAARCTGFVYVVSRMGVTGADRHVGEQARDRIEQLRRLTSKPLALGFGIASPADAAAVAMIADGVIVGSALVDRIAAAPSAQRAVEDLREFCFHLAQACHRSNILNQTIGS